IYNNTVVTKGDDTNYGIYLSLSSRNNVTNNIVSTVDTDDSNYGIYVEGLSTDNGIYNNTISTSSESTDSAGHGIAVLSSGASNPSNGVIENNTIRTYGSAGYGIYFSGVSSTSKTAGHAVKGNVITSSGSTGYGIRLTRLGHSALTNNTINTSGSSAAGYYLDNISSTNITNSTVKAAGYYAMFLTAVPAQNAIYNNILNGSDGGVGVSSGDLNDWNTTLTAGTNIVGGSNIGGNYYINNSISAGFSETCSDSDADSICDSSVTHRANNIDYLPLAKVDAAAPIVTLTFPTDGSYVGSNVTFNFTALDENGIKNATIYTNFTGTWAANNTNTTPVVNGGNSSINVPGVPDGYYIWNAYVCDNSTIGNCGFAGEDFVIIVDTSGFTISFNSPTDNGQSITNRDHSYVNVTTSRVADRVFLEWNGVNETMTGSGTSWLSNKTDLANANYTFRVWANDTSGNVNVSTTRTVYINVTLLVSESLSPSSGIISETVAVSGRVTQQNGTSAPYSVVRINATDFLPAWYSNSSSGITHDYRFPVVVESTIAATDMPVYITGQNLKDSTAGLDLSSIDITTLEVIDPNMTGTAEEQNGHKLPSIFNDLDGDSLFGLSDYITFNITLGAGQKKLIYLYDPLLSINVTQTLLPDGTGGTDSWSQFPDSGNKWDKITDGTPDDDSTYVHANTAVRQIFNLSDFNGSGVINSITVYTYTRGESGQDPLFYILLNISGTVYQSTGIQTGTSGSYSLKSYAWTTNPATGAAWPWSAVNGLQTGLLWAGGAGEKRYITQMYAIISYNITPTTSLNSRAIEPMPSINDSAHIYANITDVSSNITIVNFTVISPTGRSVVSGSGTNYTRDIWNSTDFAVNESGQWNVTVWATSYLGATNASNFTFLAGVKKSVYPRETSTVGTIAVLANSNGNYNASFTMPSVDGTYAIPVNATYGVQSGQNTTSIVITDPNKIILTSPNFDKTAGTVGARLVFHIGPTKSNNTIVAEDRYTAAESGGITVSLVSADGTVGTRVNKGFTSSDMALEIRETRDNKIILAFVNGTNATILGKLDSFGEGKAPPRALGAWNYHIPAQFPLYMQLAYDDVDIIDGTRIPASAAELLISNEGKNSRGLPEISLRVI
ncbi:MAG: hypothetical protein HY364_02450, partial [Candidatus Aenigmarchaeota archaeon]|nr:hypothetical protein [Candidatus Aenigmarchaeota archaeon]